ncbi:MAG: hypothetical protein V3U43_02510 [Pseudomonadales bacterium]
MAKNRHTFAKRQREIEKKRKAEEKRARRRNKKNQGPATDTPVEGESAVEVAEVVEGDSAESSAA